MDSKSGSKKTRETAKRRQLGELQEMLKTPTNNIGLAFLFKKFVLIGEQYQREEVSETIAPPDVSVREASTHVHQAARTDTRRKRFQVSFTLLISECSTLIYGS